MLYPSSRLTPDKSSPVSIAFRVRGGSVCYGMNEGFTGRRSLFQTHFCPLPSLRELGQVPPTLRLGLLSCKVAIMLHSLLCHQNKLNETTRVTQGVPGECKIKLEGDDFIRPFPGFYLPASSNLRSLLQFSSPTDPSCESDHGISCLPGPSFPHPWSPTLLAVAAPTGC